jgi:hypothetical protein
LRLLFVVELEAAAPVPADDAVAPVVLEPVLAPLADVGEGAAVDAADGRDPTAAGVPVVLPLLVDDVAVSPELEVAPDLTGGGTGGGPRRPPGSVIVALAGAADARAVPAGAVDVDGLAAGEPLDTGGGGGGADPGRLLLDEAEDVEPAADVDPVAGACRCGGGGAALFALVEADGRLVSEPANCSVCGLGDAGPLGAEPCRVPAVEAGAGGADEADAEPESPRA